METLDLQDDSGFSLAELLVVVAIISILALIAHNTFSRYKTLAYDANSRADLQSLYLTCKLYWHDKGSAQTCTVASVSTASYGYASNPEVTLSGSGQESDFSATASHANSPTTFTIDSRGALTDS